MSYFCVVFEDDNFPEILNKIGDMWIEQFHEGEYPGGLVSILYHSELKPIPFTVYSFDINFNTIRVY
jgi:hypothetical protein